MVIAVMYATALAAAQVSSNGQIKSCRDRLAPETSHTQGPPRNITAADLIELRDFGFLFDLPGGQDEFSLSPDNRFAAINMRRANVGENGYCLGIAIVDLENGAVRFASVGGEPILVKYDLRGIADTVAGAMDLPKPVWSSDGRWVYFLRKDEGVTQIWRAATDRDFAEPLTHESVDVRRFSKLRGDDSFIYLTRRKIAAAENEIEREGKAGFVYDERFRTLIDNAPAPSADTPFDYSVVSIGQPARPARSDEIAELARSSYENAPDGALLTARDESGSKAWVSYRYPDRYTSSKKLEAMVGGTTYTCDDPSCDDRIIGIWWRSSDNLIFLRDWSGKDLGNIEFFRWSPGSSPVSLFKTRDVLMGCMQRDSDLICSREASTQPKQLVSVVPETGKVRTIFDPNPGFGNLRKGAVQRLPDRSSDGATSFADLLLPPNHQPGQKHPLVIVQYNIRGFLRGGTGDEYPLQLLAANGYAVLGFQRPSPVSFDTKTATMDENHRLNVENWADRRRNFTALESAVDAAIETGAVDADEIGITGLSDGAATTCYAILNSRRYKAAAISSGCEDPIGLTYVGPAFVSSTRTWGYPPAGSESKAFWEKYSLSVSAERVHTPILIQAADSEYRLGIEAFSVLRAACKPIEMFVFPNEVSQ